MRLIVAGFLLMFNFCAINGQTTDSVAEPKGFFNKWRVAGISLSVGRHNALNKDNWSPVFEKLLSTDFARNKWNADKNAIAQFPIQNMEMRYNLTGGMRLGVTFKPRILKPNKIISYTEINAGLRYFGQEVYLKSWGSTSSYQDTVTSYYVNYDYYIHSVQLDGLFTIQTPGLFNCLSFYTGLGAYGGKPINTSIWASNSVKFTTNYNAVSQEDTIINPDHQEFYKPVLNWGVFIPIGVKLSLSPRSNVFIEYIFTCHVQHFKHGPLIPEWYRGFTFGYRFKLFTERDAEDEGIPQPPKPFY